MAVNYAILVSDEIREFSILIDHLEKYIDLQYVIVVIDTDKQSQYIIDLCIEKGIKHYFRSLNMDFSGQRNFLKEMCDQEYIFYIDADELPPVELTQELPLILENNPDIDLIYVPRINTLEIDMPGKTIEDIPKLRIGGIPDSNGRIAWPDYQARIIKNIPEIQWTKTLHETITGYNYAVVAHAIDKYALIHNKRMSEQIKRREFYDRIKSL